MSTNSLVNVGFPKLQHMISIAHAQFKIIINMALTFKMMWVFCIGTCSVETRTFKWYQSYYQRIGLNEPSGSMWHLRIMPHG